MITTARLTLPGIKQMFDVGALPPRSSTKPGSQRYRSAGWTTSSKSMKGGWRKVGTLAYDSQLDTFAEECRNAE